MARKLAGQMAGRLGQQHSYLRAPALPAAPALQSARVGLLSACCLPAFVFRSTCTVFLDAHTSLKSSAYYPGPLTHPCYSLASPSLQVMAELFGKKTGCCRGQGGSMHMFDREHGLVGGSAACFLSACLHACMHGHVRVLPACLLSCAWWSG